MRQSSVSTRAAWRQEKHLDGEELVADAPAELSTYEFCHGEPGSICALPSLREAAQSGGRGRSSPARCRNAGTPGVRRSPTTRSSTSTGLQRPSPPRPRPAGSASPRRSRCCLNPQAASFEPTRLTPCGLIFDRGQSPIFRQASPVRPIAAGRLLSQHDCNHVLVVDCVASPPAIRSPQATSISGP